MAATRQTPVRVRVLGSGDAFGSGGRYQTCFAIEAPSGTFLLDCGASSLIAMKRFGVSPSVIETILVTHLHGDHFGGIPFFILDAQLVSKRRTPLTVAGPPGIDARLRDAMEVLFPGSSRVERTFPVEIVELPAQTVTQVGPVRVWPEPVVHGSGAPTYALRVECDGRVIGYSGDTEWTERLLPIASGADLFICETSVYDGPVKGHIDYRTLLSRHELLACNRIMLTHMGDDMLARAAGLELECAEDGQVIAL